MRSTLACSDGDAVSVAIVSLPKAVCLQLQPHRSAFSACLSACPDPRRVLEDLLVSFPAVSVGDVLQLAIGEARFALDVLEVRGLPAIRCGLPPGMQRFDVAAALQSVPGEQRMVTRGHAVRAACLVRAARLQLWDWY